MPPVEKQAIGSVECYNRERRCPAGQRQISFYLESRERTAMRYLKQFTIILAISFLGEALHYLIPLPVPASIYGLLLMLAALLTGAVKLSSVRETGKFLVDIMPVMFIPAAVGLLESWGVLQPVWLPVALITLVSTLLVMGASGLAAQAVLRRDREGERQ